MARNIKKRKKPAARYGIGLGSTIAEEAPPAGAIGRDPLTAIPPVNGG
jgi:hypothetical protein